MLKLSYVEVIRVYNNGIKTKGDKMKLESKFMIESEVVIKINTLGEFDIYQSKNTNSEQCIIFFVYKKTNDVDKKLTITADCAQNCGYISDVIFE